MTLQQLQDELHRQETELQDYTNKVIAPAKNAVEASARAIEKARRFHTQVNQQHTSKVTDLEAAHQEASNRRQAIHALTSKIQNLAGSDALKRVVTAGADLGMSPRQALDAGVGVDGVDASGEGSQS